MDSQPLPPVQETPEQPKVLTNADILRSKGMVEVINPDGSRSQVSIEEAKKRIDAAEELKKQLENQ